MFIKGYINSLVTGQSTLGGAHLRTQQFNTPAAANITDTMARQADSFGEVSTFLYLPEV